MEALPDRIKKSEDAVAETIENNVRKLIINESPVDPAYYEKMSRLLDALIEQRRKGVVSYKEYLARIAELARDVATPGGQPTGYPASLNTAAKQALYNNLWQNEKLALRVNKSILENLQDGWRDNTMKTKRVRQAIRQVLMVEIPADQGLKVQQGDAPSSQPLDLEVETDRILALAKHQNGY